jgi:hypothetical protein
MASGRGSWAPARRNYLNAEESRDLRLVFADLGGEGLLLPEDEEEFDDASSCESMTP